MKKTITKICTATGAVVLGGYCAAVVAAIASPEFRAKLINLSVAATTRAVKSKNSLDEMLASDITSQY